MGRGDLDPASFPRVEADPTTAAALRKRGGRLYVWRDEAGLKHVRTRAPRAPMELDELEGDGFTLYVESEIAPPTTWVVVRHRFPWPRFDALHDPRTTSWLAGTLDSLP